MILTTIFFILLVLVLIPIAFIESILWLIVAGVVVLVMLIIAILWDLFITYPIRLFLKLRGKK